ncbi:hypothetical protein [Kitasatospora aureofaciens]|uniref:hypothetical protein n=1 Tax=Kitasatospora aureofaciens TaxID=1894 RepID=UPI0033E4E008
MPRTPASGADAELIQALAERGVSVSVYQLERWRTAGYLPRHPRRGLGRGRGTRSFLRPETLVQAEALARTAQQGRAPLPSLQLYRDVGTGSAAALRATLVGQLRHMAAEVGMELPETGSAPADEGDEASDARAEAILEAARRRAPLVDAVGMHNVLLDIAADAGHDVADVPRMPEWKPGSIAVAALRAFAGGPNAMGLDEFAEAIGEALGLPEQEVERVVASVAAEEVEARSHGRDPWDDLGEIHDARTMLAALVAAEDEDLNRATEAVITTSTVQLMAIVGAATGLAGSTAPLSMRPDGVLRMLGHPLWWRWGQFVTAGAVTRQDSIAFQTAMALDTTSPVNTDGLLDYQLFLRAELGLADGVLPTTPAVGG